MLYLISLLAYLIYIVIQKKEFMWASPFQLDFMNSVYKYHDLDNNKKTGFVLCFDSVFLV